MVISPIVLAWNIFTFGAGAEGEEAVSGVTKALKAKDFTGAKAALGRALELYASRSIADMTTEEVAQTLARRFTQSAQRWVVMEYAKSQYYLMAQKMDPSVAESFARDLAGLDPTGVAQVVAAFAQPKCAASEPFPNVKTYY